MRSFTCFGVSAVMRRFSNIGVSAARYKITTAKIFAKCADFHTELINAYNFAFTIILHMRSFTCFGASAVISRFSNIGVSAARYKITTAKMFAKCADFHAELINAFTYFAYMRNFTCFRVSAVMHRFSNIGVSTTRYRITTAKMFAKYAEFQVLESAAVRRYSIFGMKN